MKRRAATQELKRDVHRSPGNLIAGTANYF
jgi:hypothetical protein